mmetsp:Transcript_17588/g.36729  ORF Transcript_17588/g.36729 Transcript_17588/m.36729 type:complete len:500 (-) Transcript_17588:264-1763(-)
MNYIRRLLLFSGLAMIGISHTILVRMEGLSSEREDLLTVPPPKLRRPLKDVDPITLNFDPMAHDNSTTSLYDITPKSQNEEGPASKKVERPGQPNVHFPLPTEAVSSSSKIILEPTFGSHRPDQNAVFALAEGYDLNVYATFIESLKMTGYQGDVVMAVSSIRGIKKDVKEYLQFYASIESDKSGIRVISYSIDWECYKKSGTKISPEDGYKEGRGNPTNHGFSDCKLHNMYSEDDSLSPAQDPRDARPVATARYELYWIWSRKYDSSSKILIIDFRDTYFQTNPFSFAASSPQTGDLITNTHHECYLDLFEENFDAINIGKSSYNSNWIKSAYGNDALKTVAAKPVICSGSTMGTQHAIEKYTIAMVAQSDERKCKSVGCDQGFHNYLYYLGNLDEWLASTNKRGEQTCDIRVHVHGEGAVNNLSAMRESPLRDQGVLKTFDVDETYVTKDGNIVVNSDGSTPSPVVHQFDRDKELKGLIRKRTSQMLKEWKSEQSSR